MPFALAEELDRTAHAFSQLARDGEAEARAAKTARDLTVRLDERLEEAMLFVGSDADARVGNADDHGLAVRSVLHVNSDPAPVGELDGVTDQVQQDLAHHVGISPGIRRPIIWKVQVQGEPMIGGREVIEVAHFTRERCEVHGRALDFDLARLQAGDIEDGIDHREQPL